jgi:predicted small lipoprotein YifL
VRSLTAVLVIGFLVACGVVGPPIAPEDVGVTPTIERQKRHDALETQKPDTAESQAEPELQGQDVNLPPLRPVGTR